MVSRDSIYLFTKQWLSYGTAVYVMPKLPGRYSARLKATFDAGGLITGASYLEPEKLLVLCGYSVLLQPFLYLLNDFQGHDFFSGQSRRVKISLPFHQVEGVASEDGQKFYLVNEERVIRTGVVYAQKLHILYLDAFTKY